MNNQIQTVTIGILAHNEANNIGNLLENILKQRLIGGVVIEIIVFSDNSQDRTAERVKSFATRGVRLIESTKRVGKNGAQNTLAREAQGDILVLLDADISLVDDNVLEHLIQPVAEDDRVGLTSAAVLSLPARTFFESVIVVSHAFKNALYQDIRHGDNIYICHGRARAFSTKLFKTIEWPETMPEDAYSFLFCKSQGLRFVFAKNAQVWFRSPATFADHLKQSQRFAAGKNALINAFGRDTVKNAYALPFGIFISTLVTFLFRKPLHILAYIVVNIATHILPTGKHSEQSRWEISLSSKKL